jgi:hypothetical protein
MSLTLRYASSSSSSAGSSPQPPDRTCEPNESSAELPQKRSQGEVDALQAEPRQSPKRPRLPPPPSLSPPRAQECISEAESRSTSLLLPPQVQRKGTVNKSVEDLQQFGHRGVGQHRGRQRTVYSTGKKLNGEQVRDHSIDRQREQGR